MAREFVMGARIELTDSFSNPIRSIIRATNNFRNNIGETDRAMGRYYDSAGRLREANGRFARATQDSTQQLNAQENQVTSLTDRVFSLQNAFVALGGAMAVKGLYDWLIEPNAQMEQYQNTLTTVLGSQEKAVKTLEWANKFAAQTPFEIPQIMEATTVMSSYGMVAQDSLGLIGDMASVMGKDLMQAVEAVADAQTGELERLKEFGITKKMIEEHAATLGKTPFDSKGSLADQEALNATLFSMMEKRFKGGMEMQASSFKGMLSNAQDFIGTLGRRLGKPIFDRMKENLKGFLGFLNNLDESGAIDRFVAGFESGITKLGNVISYIRYDVIGAVLEIFENFGQQNSANFAKIGAAFRTAFSTLKAYAFPVINWLIITAWPALLRGIAQVMDYVVNLAVLFIDNFSKFKPYIIGIATAFLLYGAYLKTVAAVTRIAAAAQAVWNAVLAMNPVTLIIIAIGLLIGWLIHLAGGWDVVKAKMLALWPVLVNAWKNIWATLQPILTMIGQKAVQIWQWLVQVVPPLLSQLWSILVTWFTNIWTTIQPLLITLWTGIVNVFNSLKSFWETWGGLIMAFFSVYWAYVSSIFQSAVSVLWTIIQGGFTVIYNVVSGIFKLISGVIQVGWALISGIFSTALALLSGDWEGAWNNMLDMLSGVWSGIEDFFAGLKDLFFDSGKAIIETLADGIRSVASAPFEAVTSALSKVRDLLPFSDAKTGPLSSLTHNGGKIVSTMAEGIYKQAGTLHKAMYSTLENTPSTVSGTVRANAYRVNPAGSRGTGSAGNSTVIKNLVEKIIIQGADKDGKQLATDLVNQLYDILSGADDILGADMGALLND